MKKNDVKSGNLKSKTIKGQGARKQRAKNSVSKKQLAQFAEAHFGNSNFDAEERVTDYVEVKAVLPADVNLDLVGSSLSRLSERKEVSFIPVAKDVAEDDFVVLTILCHYKTYGDKTTAEQLTYEINEAIGGACVIRKLETSVKNEHDAVLIRVYDDVKRSLRYSTFGRRHVPAGYIGSLKTLNEVCVGNSYGQKGNYQEIERYCILEARIEAGRSVEEVVQVLNYIESENEFITAPYSYVLNDDGSANLVVLASSTKYYRSRDYSNEETARMYFRGYLGGKCEVRAIIPACNALEDMQLVEDFRHIRNRFGDSGRYYTKATFTTRDLMSPQEQEQRLVVDRKASGLTDTTYTGTLTFAADVDMHAVVQANELLASATSISIVPRYCEQSEKGEKCITIFARKRGGLFGLSYVPIVSKDIADIQRHFGCGVELRPLEGGVENAEDLDLAVEARMTFNQGYGANSVAAWNREKPEDELSAQELLDQLIGLDDIKKQLKEIVAYAANYKKAYGIMPPLHAMFLGAPGTGKTTVARILCKMLGEAGVLDKPDRFIETDRHGLVSRYVGNSAHDTHQIVNRAMGGLLFIDEAYSLATDTGSSHNYGKEAVDALVKRMEDDRNYFVCVMAGYDKPMEKLLDLNPGLPSRIAFKLHFPNYTADELMQIFDFMLDDSVFTISEAARKLVAKQFGRVVAGTDESFSNARAVRIVIDRLQMRQLTNGGTKISAKTVESVFADEDIAPLFGSASSFGFVA